MVEQLKRFDKDRTDFEDLIALSAFGRMYRAEFEQMNDEVPDWVDQQIKAVRREIHARIADTLEMKLNKARARRSNLATTEEKRAELDKQIAELEAKTKGAGN